MAQSRPGREHHLDEAGIPTGPAHPTQMVRGADFPVEASVDRARELAAQCDGWGMVDVWALATVSIRG